MECKCPSNVSSLPLFFAFLSSGFCLVLALIARVFYCLFFVFCLFGVSDYSVRDYYLYATILHRNFLRFTPPPPTYPIDARPLPRCKPLQPMSPKASLTRLLIRWGGGGKLEC